MIRALGRAATGAVSTIVEAGEELRIHRGRVLLSLVGVAVAICALATVVAAGSIAEQAMREQQERDGGRPATYQIDLSGMSGPLDPATAAPAWETALARHGIEFAARSAQFMTDVQFADGVVSTSIEAVDPDYGPMRRVQPILGEWFADGDAGRLAPAVIVNENFWERLGSPPLETHPTVQFVGAEPRTGVVVGVVENRGQWDTDPWAYLLFDDAEALMAPSPDPMFGGLYVTYAMWLPEGDAEAIASSVVDALELELAGVDVQVSQYRTDYAAYGDDPFAQLKLVIGGVAAVVLLLGALGLLTIALVTVRTRIREIGIRRSFGATAGRVFFSVLMESVVGTFLAGVVGVGISIALVRSPLAAMALNTDDVQDLPGFPVEAAVVGIGAAVLVGALAGLIPALTAVKVKVIDAIRF
ncbi:ABC transporter permease [Agromyces seonyuensis]|uniref:FtsX-like permease family protein n=1 Tax=Agromyces seonyuensis TaxID=2662446 RepID=A0A6I4P0Y9_9MICO|nr:ABC transporter permease [Agromyces seonyuensis]MWC00259.1 FtsX-like permease family protein [Agromyces seonyuensis]